MAIFRTVDDAVIAPTTMTIELAVLADVAGKVGNGYAIGTINKILDPLAFVSTVENIDVTGGGSDVESDEQLRERIKLAPSQYSSAGSIELQVLREKCQRHDYRRVGVITGARHRADRSAYRGRRDARAGDHGCTTCAAPRMFGRSRTR